MFKKNKGFTLIELLVVIAIIGLLSTLAVVALNSARAKSRDAKRVADVKQIQTALELYMNDCNIYPESIAPTATNCPDTGITLANYMSTTPVAPTPPTGNAYTYACVSSCASYTIAFTLEGTVGNLSGASVASPSGIQ